MGTCSAFSVHLFHYGVVRVDDLRAGKGNAEDGGGVGGSGTCDLRRGDLIHSHEGQVKTFIPRPHPSTMQCPPLLFSAQ